VVGDDPPAEVCCVPAVASTSSSVSLVDVSPSPFSRGN
jgi:hypothetical protein